MGFYCKKCGQQFNDIYGLTHASCLKGGYHELYTGHESGTYHCRKCGQQFSDLYGLTHAMCHKGGDHEPLE